MDVAGMRCGSAVVGMTDRDDCSVKVYGEGWTWELSTKQRALDSRNLIWAFS